MMTSTKPYLVRAIYEWCVDQGFTPYLQVAVDANTRVPREHVREGQIVLNVGIEATHQLNMGNEEITFQARFNGAAFPIYVPMAAVAAIFARENGQGMAFETGDMAEVLEAEDSAVEGPVTEGDTVAEGPAEALPVVETTLDAVSPEQKPATGRPHLTRIK